jgi:hypothetical protein
MSKIPPDPCNDCLKYGHLCYGCNEKTEWEMKYLYDEKGNLRSSLKRNKVIENE